MKSLHGRKDSKSLIEKTSDMNHHHHLISLYSNRQMTNANVKFSTIANRTYNSS